jgi:CheY-like chemotaxis protein
MTAILLLCVIVVGAFAAFRIARGGARTPAPATEPGSEQPAAPSSKRYAFQRLRILVVDDNPLVGRTIARLLDAHEVTFATSGEAALTALALDHTLDVILCALIMPGMSGVAFAAAIAERYPALSRRMAFVIDGTSTPETRRLLALSDVRWVTKPIGYAQLATCVGQVSAQRDSTAVSPRTVTPVASVAGNPTEP